MNKQDESCGCDCQCGPEAPPVLQPLKKLAMAPAEEDVPCCGPPAGPPSSPHARAGYELCAYVKGFLETPMGPVPRVATRLSRVDLAGNLKVRLNIGRSQYMVAPGLYGVGAPSRKSPVLVTANYKLTFDCLRRELGGQDAWLLILETRGVNVWCAAGKGTLSSVELINRVKAVALDQVVSHRELILPQFAATGVAAHRVTRGCGFKVVWGPIRAVDLPAFLAAGKRATEEMRLVTFTLAERLVLIPVEIALVLKPLLGMVALIFLVSGIGPEIFSITAAWQRGLAGLTATLAGMVGGAVLVPIFLAMIPGRAFAFKGLLTGLLCGGLACLPFAAWLGTSESLALLSCATVVSSYLAMNFTGATPFTSPTGVEKEMQRAIPLQIGALAVALAAWVAAPFLG